MSPKSYSGNPHLCQFGNLTCLKSEGISPAPAAEPATVSHNTSSAPTSQPSTQMSVKDHKKTSNTGIIFGVVIAVIVLLTVLVATAIYFFRVHKLLHKRGIPNGRQEGPSAREKNKMLFTDAIQKYSYKDVQFITDNFKTVIGEGGFGPVYYGILLNGQELAVKQLSKDSHQGTREFHNEVELLSKVHHRCLVSLLGFCEELGNYILLYEYMSQGDLRDNLYGKHSSEPLNWNKRLNIALAAAQGLEYLHKGCLPAIIHRDVKSSNILLNQSYVAKVADFGLSRLAPKEGATHISTTVKGTVGYLDPEFLASTHISNQLTEKSDVFSFGVVLLEIISGRQPINTKLPKDELNLVQWARGHLREGRIEEIVDRRLRNYNLEAMWKVAEIAMWSAEPKGMHRPNMSDVVTALKDAISIENKKKPESFSVDHQSSTKFKTYHSGPQTSSVGVPDSSILEGR